MLLLFSVILTQSKLILASYGCLNENGNFVDYWVAIKAAASSNYYYYDINSNTDIFTKSPYSVSQVTQGAIMSTVYQVYSFSDGDNVALGMYNDDPPGDYTPSSTYAHAKGVLFTDTTQGFWLVQSKPNWPGELNFTLGTDAAIPFPDDNYAQSLMCVSISANTANTIATNLMIDRPYIYSTYITSTIANQLPEFNDWLNKNHNSVTTNSTTLIESLGGNDFTQFAKSQSYGEDLWDDLVAPFYKTTMNVDTWISGTGGRMSSMCGPDADNIVKYDIYQVDNITMSDGVSWLNTKDHSKWAAARVNFNSQNYASCVGDNNRMCSQEKRGGGALCTSIDSNLWNAFNHIVTSVESCFEHNPCGGSGSQCFWCPSLSPNISPTLSPTTYHTDDTTNNSNQEFVDSSSFIVTESAIIPLFLVIGIIAGIYITSFRKKSKLDKSYSVTSLYEVFFTTILSSINFISSILFAVAVINMGNSIYWIFYTIVSVRFIVSIIAIYLFNNINIIESSDSSSSSSSLYILLIKLLMIIDNTFVKYLPLSRDNVDTIESNQVNSYTSTQTISLCTGSSLILYITIIFSTLHYLLSKQSTPFAAIYITLILSFIQLFYLCICGISNYTSNDGSILQELINSLTPGRTKENIHLKKNVNNTPAFTISPVHDNNESKSRINSTTVPSIIRISVDEQSVVNKKLTKLVYNENNLSNSPNGNSLL